ncbi:cytosine permease, partial [Bacillus licheniformis]
LESIRRFEVWAGPLVYLVFGGMVWWAVDIAGGLGPIYSQPGKFQTFSELIWPFLAGVTGIIGIWATLILNIPDFTRFAASQKEQIRGQFYGLPGTFVLQASPSPPAHRLPSGSRFGTWSIFSPILTIRT